ncbi:MAG TPA: TatD family hydrolase [Candidatus Competibacteraceae bacterium]|nr:TatD family hydrolase [Candidatus Competibacteraceae bacterium]
MLVDSHCHLDRLDLTPFDGDLGQALAAAAANGVGHFLCVAIDLAHWSAMLERVRPYRNVSVSVGVHPSETLREQAAAEELVRRAAANPRVVAIGETGLDYYYGKDSRAEQQRSFRIHVAAAIAAGKPLIVHTRDAKEDTLAILKEEGAERVGGVLHCFTEDWDMAERAMELGFYVSFSGIVTFRNAESLREVARRMPAERLLVETDAPYLAPVPYRGKSNQPAWVKHVAECLAAVREEPFEQLAATTTANYFRLFGHGTAA